MTWLRRGLIALLALFALETAAIVLAGLGDRLAPSDLAIVLGCKVEPDGRASPALASRLDKTLQLYRRGLFPAVMVSGGVDGFGHDEARVMRDWLVARGVPAQAIIVDSHGDNTGATARNAAALMRARGWRRAMVISQYFHIARARLALSRQGIGGIRSAHADRVEIRDLYSVPREAVGYPAYWLGWRD